MSASVVMLTSQPIAPARPLPPVPRRWRRLRALLAALTTFAVLALVVLALLLGYSLERAPLVRRSESIAPATIAQAKKLLANNDPRRLRRGDRRTMEVPASLIDEGVNHVASRLLRGRAAFVLGDGVGELRVSFALPLLGDACYVNLRTVLADADGEPRIASGSIGPLALPATIVDWVIAGTVRATGFSAEWQLARQSIRRLAFDGARNTVSVSYVWEPGLLKEAISLALPGSEVDLLRVAHYELAALVDHYAPRVRVPLAYVLAPLVGRNGSATPAEAKAALLVLASFAAEKPLAVLLPEARKWPRIRPVRLTLMGRYDSAQHFAVSAALAAWAGEPAANAIGLFKEIDDSRGGSGFSFADLAADRAGTRFGQLVATDFARVQEALAAPLTDRDLAPPLADLPEHLSLSEFQRRFGGGDNRLLLQLTTEIEQRLALLPLYGNTSGERSLLASDPASD